MTSHEDCTADNVDEPIENILDLPDGFEAEMLPDRLSGVAGGPDRRDQQPVPDSDVISSDEDWERQIFSAQLSNRGAVHPFEDSFHQDAERSFQDVTPLEESFVEDVVEGIEDSFHQDAERSFQDVTPLEESFVEDVVEGIIEDESYSILPLSPMQVGEGTADTVHSKRYAHKYT